jgi:hypothetical protein
LRKLCAGRIELNNLPVEVAYESVIVVCSEIAGDLSGGVHLRGERLADGTWHVEGNEGMELGGCVNGNQQQCGNAG